MNAQFQDNKNLKNFNEGGEPSVLKKDYDQLEELQKKTTINQLSQVINNPKDINGQILNENNLIRQKIELLTKKKLENENEINALKKINNELNITIQRISAENNVLKKELNNRDLILKQLKIKTIQEESEFNNLKKINADLSNEINIIKQKNTQLLSDITKKNESLEKLKKGKKLMENKYQSNQLLISSTINDYEQMLKENKNYQIQLKKYIEKIKVDSEKFIHMENEIEKLNNKIKQYENKNILLKSELLVEKKNNAFITSDKQELIEKNDKLNNDLTNLNIKFNQTTLSMKNIEEENLIMKHQKMDGHNYLEFLKNNNTFLINENRKLKQNLDVFIMENKNCAFVIKNLRNENQILNNEIGKLMNDKNELLSQIKTFDKSNNKSYIDSIKDKEDKNKRYIKSLNYQIINLHLHIEYLQNQVKELLNINKNLKTTKIYHKKELNIDEYKDGEEINVYNGKNKLKDNNNFVNNINEELRSQIDDLNNNVKKLKENINKFDCHSSLKKTNEILKDKNNNN